MATCPQIQRNYKQMCLKPGKQFFGIHHQQQKNQLVRQFTPTVSMDRMLPGPILDFTRNIQGNWSSSDSYENWISIPDEDSVLGNNSATQSITLNMPQPYVLLLNHLIRESLKIKTSSRIHLDIDFLSLHLAPHVLWDQTCRNSLFGRDCSEKMSLMQIMIDNNVDVLGDDDSTICNDSQKRSDDIKMSLNTAGWDYGKTSTYNVPQRNYLFQIVSLTILFFCCVLYIFTYYNKFH
ncbi:rho GTPase-activating protein 20-like isoform X1 [Arvicanthis niloticus]|uniref:rho GTPase-activating protein 20-like isoform X1 n=1 Tax=Arvicanthis niloticus TaxID=61156 RepID=UPI00403C66DA